jgi:hypothetical protein
MRIALASLFVVVLCCAGYGVAFQQSPVRQSAAGDLHTRAKALQDSARSALPFEERVVGAGHAVVAPDPEAYAPAPVSPYSVPSPMPPRAAARVAGWGASEGPAGVPSPMPPRAAAPFQQQLAVIISKSGLRFLSPRSGIDIDEIELQGDSLLVICDSADVTTDAEGKPEVVCRAAGVIKAAGLSGKSSELRYKAGCLILEGDESDSLIARNKGDKTVFMLRARTININLNTQQIEASDGSVIQLKPEPKAVPEASLPSLPSASQ